MRREALRRLHGLSSNTCNKCSRIGADHLCVDVWLKCWMSGNVNDSEDMSHTGMLFDGTAVAIEARQQEPVLVLPGSSELVEQKPARVCCSPSSGAV